MPRVGREGAGGMAVTHHPKKNKLTPIWSMALLSAPNYGPSPITGVLPSAMFGMLKWNCCGKISCPQEKNTLSFEALGL